MIKRIKHHIPALILITLAVVVAIATHDATAPLLLALIGLSDIM